MMNAMHTKVFGGAYDNAPVSQHQQKGWYAPCQATHLAADDNLEEWVNLGITYALSLPAK